MVPTYIVCTSIYQNLFHYWGISYACADTSNHIRGKQCPVHPNYGVPQAQKVAKGYSTLRHLKRATTTLELLPLGGMLNKAACFWSATSVKKAQYLIWFWKIPDLKNHCPNIFGLSSSSSLSSFSSSSSSSSYFPSIVKIQTFTLALMPSVQLTLSLTKGIIITTLSFLSLLSKAAAAL